MWRMSTSEAHLGFKLWQLIIAPHLAMTDQSFKTTSLMHHQVFFVTSRGYIKKKGEKEATEKRFEQDTSGKKKSIHKLLMVGWSFRDSRILRAQDLNRFSFPSDPFQQLSTFSVCLSFGFLAIICVSSDCTPYASGKKYREKKAVKLCLVPTGIFLWAIFAAFKLLLKSRITQVLLAYLQV